MHVLICDDDAGTRLLLRHMVVQRLGWSARECVDGAEALQALGREQFDLAIIDLNMPQIDGISVVQTIRTSPRLRDLPVVVVTSDQRAEIVHRLLDLGIADYIVKPLTVATAMAKLERLGRPRPAATDPPG